MLTDRFFAAATRFRDRILPARTQARLATPRALLVGFLVVHAGYLVFAFVVSLTGNTFSDTGFYQAWAAAGFDDARLGHGPSPWVYPVLAQVPMAIAGAFGHGPFFFCWVLLISLLDFLAMGLLTDWWRKPEKVAAGWWWLVFLGIMGPLGFARVDGMTAPIVLAAVVLGVARPFVSSLVLGLVTWVKVWPAAVMVALLAAARRRGLVVLGGVVSTLVAVGAAALSGSVDRILDFLTQQGDRGMQLEATFTTPGLWMAVLHVGDSRMYMNTDINSMQVTAPGSDLMARLMQPLFVVAAIVVVVLIARGLRRGVRDATLDRTALFLTGSLTMVASFIVFNKVGSPQFIVWLGPVVAVGLVHDWRHWRVPAVLALCIAVATFLVYPMFYDALSHNNPIMALVLTFRNVLLVVMLWWSARGLIRLGTARKEPTGAGIRD